MKPSETKPRIIKPVAVPYKKWFKDSYWAIVGRLIAPTNEELDELAELVKERLTAK